VGAFEGFCGLLSRVILYKMAEILPVSASEKYSGRPGKMPLDDLWDMLFAAQEAKSG
jgi:hypothetical protein